MINLLKQDLPKSGLGEWFIALDTKSEVIFYTIFGV